MHQGVKEHRLGKTALLGILVGTLSGLVFSCGNDSREFPAQLQLNGVVSATDQQEALYQVIVETAGQDDADEPCRAVTPITTVTLNEDGSFSSSLPTSRFGSLSSQDCDLEVAGLDAVRSLTMKVWIPEGATTFVGRSSLSGEDLRDSLDNPQSDSVDLPQVQLASVSTVEHGGSPSDLAIDFYDAANSVRFSEESFEQSSCAVVEGCVGGTGTRRLMRFSTTIQNLGGSDIVLGDPENNPQFEFSACHAHHHLRDITSYELLDAATFEVVNVNGQNVTSRKQGFCFMDREPISGEGAPVYDCEFQGLSSGWGDVYGSELDCQWLDITGVPAGRYVLRLTVNPTGLFTESDLTNNAIAFPVDISSAGE